ncbi:MAG TPA: hypothetical protein VFW20_03275 [Candidatus Limnocylindrales bacterium]|nr:hypothetical protein [Candidatus Limnocylindrales bacterium]
MANAQKRGFRFPWGGDERPDESADLHAVTAEGLAERLGTTSDDLDQPMHPADTAEEEQTVAERAAVAESSVEDEAGAVSEMTDAAPEPRARAAWPEHDRRGSERPFAAAGSPPSAPSSRATNPLVAGLVKAMREAARTARGEAVSTLRSEASAREEAIRADSTANAGELRKVADADIAGIREWSKAELTRVREETEHRIGARRDQLVAETEAEAQATEQTLQRLADAVARFEAETDAFFEALLAEEDPARLAGLAERMPQPPTLDDFSAVRVGTLDAGEAGVPPPVAEDGSEPKTATAPEVEPEPGAEAVAEDSREAAADTRADAGDHLDPETAAAAEAESLAGLDGQTQLLVSGLSGMAAIAAFKGGLLHVPGVSAVSVMTTASGEIAFTVTHDAEADLRDALRSMPGFAARVMADDGSSVMVAATAVAA